MTTLAEEKKALQQKTANDMLDVVGYKYGELPQIYEDSKND